MTREQQLELIRQKCIEANPERDWFTPIPQPIRLADVLLAIPKYLAIGNTGQFMDASDVLPDEPIYWNLRKDNLTEQGDECITFLAELLA